MLTAEQKQLVEDNWLLVRFVIKKYFRGGQGYSVEYDDMEQIGYLGLCNAAKLYDRKKGSFATYACIVIRSQICRHFRSLNAPTRRGNLLAISLQQEYANGRGSITTLEDILPDERSDIEDQVLIYQVLHQIASDFGKDLKTDMIIGCLTGDISQAKAAERVGVSQGQMSRYLTAYKRHLQEAVR